MIWRLLIFSFYVMSQIAFGAEDSFDSLLGKGKAHLRQGQYYLAVDDLQSAQTLAVTPPQQAQVKGTLGLVHYRMHHYEQADTFLRQSIVSGASDTQDRTRWMAALAELQDDRGLNEDASHWYAEALKLAGNDQKLIIGIQLGQAALLPSGQRLAELSRIRGSLGRITDPSERARYFLNIGTQAQHLGAAGLKLAYNSFEQARQYAGGQQPRLLAESLDGLAQLYEGQKRDDEALRLNRLAIQSAQSIEAHDLLLNLEWRQGRLNRHQQRIPDALVAYQHAVEHIEAIRQDIPVEYHNGRSSFRQTLEPVYLGLADMLLAQASQQNGENKTLLLRRARETVELIKQSELEDFLGGRCAVHSSKNALLEAIEPTTAIIYPILLPDRLELLVSSGSEIRQYTQPVSAATLQQLAQHFAHSLRKGKDDIKPIAQALYQWLIAPIEPWLHQHQVKTLVMVPDGVLRLIPPAALHDGEHYLIENYALAISPGLTLFEPTPLQQHSVKALLAGMSEAGSVVEHLPPAFLRAMAGASGRGVDLNDAPLSRALPVNEETGDITDQARKIELERDVERLLKEPIFRQKIKDQLSLPGVAQEIDSLKREIPNTLLMNDGFTVEKFKDQVVKEPYSVIHIASHGVFGKTADTSFIMAYDGVINIDDLEQLLKSEKFAKQPVELLTLSACQTAEGDDRAPLGLSGIALKAKVRSALGSLWPVSDEAASLLMAEFYKALSHPGTSKVQALRQAQIILLKKKSMENPFYWSPFILAGNWL
ncbi:MAG: CHAT domain-containing protein [Methylovulum sp.]|nr:CHAT domain-containing protein [Methylovulum sp.]